MFIIKPEQLKKLGLLVNEPVDKISNDIINNDSKKIILNSNRGTGKSIVLNDIQNKSLNTYNQTIYTGFDSMLNITSKPDSYFDDKFFKHYYELIISLKLLSYIKNNYPKLYEDKFKSDYEYLKFLANCTDNYIKDYWFDYKLYHYLKQGVITERIIKKFKQNTNIDKLNIAIDDFDSIYAESYYTQELLSNYFHLFDKTIITVNEPLSNNKKYKDFDIETISYNRDINIIKQIIQKRIALYNLNKTDYEYYFDQNNITDDMYLSLIIKTNGNISLMIEIIYNLIKTYNFYDKKIDIENELNKEINIQVNTQNKLRKINKNKPKFYL